MNLQEQLTEVETLIAAESAKGGEKNYDNLAKLEQKQAVILMQMDDEKVKQEQERAAQVRIQEVTDNAAYRMDNLVIEGFTVRELALGEKEYQLLKIGVQGEFIALDESANTAKQLLILEHKDELRAAADRETQLKRQNDELQKAVDEQAEKSIEAAGKESLQQQRIAQLELEIKHANAQRDAAVAEKEGIELMLKTKQEEIELMRTEKAVGAVNAPHVIDMEARRDEMKELANQIKASRIHVYDVVPDSEINPKNYTAKRADTGVEVKYNWTQTRNYIEIKDAAEVERFRQQFANKEAVSDSPLGHEETLNVTPTTALEEAIQAIPSAIPPQVSAVPAAVVEGQQSVEVPGEAITSAQLEDRLVKFAQEHGLVKQAVA